MRALQLVAWGSPPELREVPEPTPGPGEVVIRIGGAGACHSDLHLLHDVPAGADVPLELPFTLGHENAGWVATLGPGVSGVEPGEPVAVFGHWGCGACRRCRSGEDNHCERPPRGAAAGGGIGLDGGMADLLRVPSPRYLVPLGDLDPVTAAPLTDAALTPYHAIRRSLPRLRPGSSVVVIGIGGLGHVAVQLVRALSAARVVAVDQRPQALDLALRSGATRAVLAGPEAGAEILDATEGRGAHLVLDVVGTDDTLRLALAAAAPLADVVVIGIAGGTVPFGTRRVRPGVSVATTYWGTPGELLDVIELARAGHLELELQRFPLDRAAAAYEALHRGEVQGRAVVVP